MRWSRPSMSASAVRILPALRRVQVRKEIATATTAPPVAPSDLLPRVLNGTYPSIRLSLLPPLFFVLPSPTPVGRFALRALSWHRLR
jgi:hypothetical protein